MNTKKLIPAIVIGSMLLSTNVYASDITVTLNDQPIEFTTPAPQLVGDRTLLPLRGLFDKMGYEISWDSATKTATLTGKQYILYAKSGSLTALDRSTMKISAISSDVSPQLIDGYFMLPVRAVAEATDADVNWNSGTRTVEIYTSDYEVADKTVDVNGNMSTTENEYLTKTFELVTKLKDTTKASKDAPMLRFLGLDNINDTVVTATISDYSKTAEILSELSALEPPENMKEIDQQVENYVAVVEKAYKLCQSSLNGDVTSEELTKQIDTLKAQREYIAIQHGVVLYQYFTKASVMYEQIYGDYILDILK